VESALAEECISRPASSPAGKVCDMIRRRQMIKPINAPAIIPGIAPSKSSRA
jgi:hypothetical protein